MRVTQRATTELATALLAQRGSPPTHAALQATVLVEAELRGVPSHGLQRLPRLLRRIENGVVDAATLGTGRWRSSGVYEVDGKAGLGPVVAIHALRHIVERASTTGIAVAAIRNSNHLGMLAYYVEQIAASGQIGIVTSSSEALVHPFNGTRAMLGTNPLAIAVPTAGRPLVIDLATSVVSMGKIHHHAANDLPIPLGWARDAEGRPTADATLAKHGSIAPFGEAKGYCLGIALELLIAALAGSALAPDVKGTLDADEPCNKGDVIIAIQPASVPDLLEKLKAYLDLVRASPAADPATPVSVPGDGAASRRSAALEAGFEISASLWAELNSLRNLNSPAVEGQTQ